MAKNMQMNSQREDDAHSERPLGQGKQNAARPDSVLSNIPKSEMRGRAQMNSQRERDAHFARPVGRSKNAARPDSAPSNIFISAKNQAGGTHANEFVERARRSLCAAIGPGKESLRGHWAKNDIMGGIFAKKRHSGSYFARSDQSPHFEDHEDGRLGEPEHLSTDLVSPFGLGRRIPLQWSPRQAFSSLLSGRPEVWWPPEGGAWSKPEEGDGGCI